MANLGQNLSQRLFQGQTLALTPAMQLKLKLWQMNLLELSQTIERELEENPLLELVEEGDEAPSMEAIEEGHDSEVLEESSAEGVELPDGVDTVDLGPLLDSASEMNPESDLEAFTEAGVAQVLETDMGAENSWDADVPRTSSLPDDERSSWEDRLTSNETLQEHLLAQLYQTMEADDPRAALLERLIEHVDPKGFLRLDPDRGVETNPAELAQELGLDEAMILEYSGRHLALWEWAASLKLFAYSCIGLAIFFPWGVAQANDPLALLWALPVLVFKLAVGGFLLAVIEAVSAKMRIFRVPEFLGTAFLLAVIGLLVNVLLGAG